MDDLPRIQFNNDLSRNNRGQACDSIFFWFASFPVTAEVVTDIISEWSSVATLLIIYVDWQEQSPQASTGAKWHSLLLMLYLFHHGYWPCAQIAGIP